MLATLQFQVISQSASTTITFGLNAIESPPSNILSGIGSPITPTPDQATATVSYAAGGAPAADAGVNQTVLAGTAVTLDGSKSVSSGSSPSYTWSFTDGTQKTLSGITATYTFNTAGTYLVTLTVQDSNGQSNVTTTITVGTKPVANIKIEGLGSAQSATVRQSVTFDASGSTGTIQKYLWDMGDGSPSIQTTNTTITYAYGPSAINMTYNVTLTVFDVSGLNGTATTSIKVLSGAVGTSGTSPPSATPTDTQDSTSTPTPTSNLDATSTPIQTITQPASSLPPAILVIIVIITLVVLGGSTFWLRKRT